MRKSFLTTAALAVCFTPTGFANAACYGPECSGVTPSYKTSSYKTFSHSYTGKSHALAGGAHQSKTSSAIIYGSSPVYKSSSSTTYRSSSSSACPSGSTRAADGACIVNGPSRVVSHTSSTSYSSYTPSYASSSYSSTRTAPCPAGSHREGGVCMSDSTGTIYASSSPSVTIIPFSSSEPRIRATRLAGLGANESLVPTSCPTSVYNPEGAKVLGCYSVNKPVVRKVYVQPQLHTVRVVRPVIYVRYPVPTPYAVPVMTQCSSTWTRYGEAWPGRGCRAW